MRLPQTIPSKRFSAFTGSKGLFCRDLITNGMDSSICLDQAGLWPRCYAGSGLASREQSRVDLDSQFLSLPAAGGAGLGAGAAAVMRSSGEEGPSSSSRKDWTLLWIDSLTLSGPRSLRQVC